MSSIHHNKSLGLLVIRIVVGVLFIIHGYLKLSSMSGATGTIAMFGSMGFAPFWVYVISLVEFFGGISLVLGYGSKIAASLLAFSMLVAIFTVHRGAGLMGPNGAELPLVMFGATLGLALAGPGKYGFGSCCGCPVKQGTCPVGGTCTDNCCKK